jgi:3-oxoacyl-[acyl-carrier protein] reductase
VDLAIKGRRALVCASSRGLGRGCAFALAAEGVHVTLTGRTADSLAATAAEIRRAYPQVEIGEVVGDITTSEGQDQALAACPEPDILINNAGGPPPGDFRDWSHDDWIKALDANMLTPIALIRRTVDGMMARNFGRIINITSSAVKAPIGLLGLSNGARSGLTGFVGGVARQVANRGVTINGLLPGSFETDRFRNTVVARAEADNIDPEEMMQRVRQGNPTGRLGSPEEFGKVCAFLCSVHAGYINGQNILLDGGLFPGSP